MTHYWVKLLRKTISQTNMNWNTAKVNDAFELSLNE